MSDPQTPRPVVGLSGKSSGRFGPSGATLRATAAVVAASVIVALSLQNRGLRARLDVMTTLRVNRMFPEVGQWVYPVRAAALRGDSVTIGSVAEGRSEVLIVFTTSCPVCRASLTEWKRVTAQLLADSAARYDVRWVSLSPRDSTEQYVREHGIDAPVVFPPNGRMMPAYRVFGVPMTLVIDSRGRFTHVRAKLFATPGATDSVVAAAGQAAARRERDRGNGLDSAGIVRPARPLGP